MNKKDYEMITEVVINENFTRCVKSIDQKNNFSGGAILPEPYTPYMVKSIMSTRDFISAINKKFNISSDILPQNCKYVENFLNGNKFFIIEEEPAIRSISFSIDPFYDLEILKETGKYELYGLDKKEISNPYRVVLSFPYIVYAILLDKNNSFLKLEVFFRLHPITSFNDYLLKPCLPNISSSYKVCMGTLTSTKGGNSNEIVRNIINTFWMNSFNGDYFEHCSLYKRNVIELSDFFTWEYNSKIDPLFIYSIKWIDSNLTIANLIKISSEFSGGTDILNCMIFEDLKNITIRESSYETKNNMIKRFSESRLLTESAIIESNLILSIGDELNIDGNHFYIISFKNDLDYGTIAGIIVEDESGVKTELNTKDKRIINQIKKQFETNKELKSLNIKGINHKVNDIVQFKFTNQIKMIDKIVKCRDGSIHVKIGDEYYLENAFLNNNLSKIDNLTYMGKELKENKEYYILLRSTNIGTSKYYHVTFSNFFNMSGGIKIKFICLKTKDEITYDINDENTIIESEELSPSPLAVHMNEIHFIGSYNSDVMIFPKKCIAFENSEGYTTTLYDRDGCKKYLEENYQGKESITFQFVDHNITYSLKDEVILIDWMNPESMFKIWTICAFKCDEKYFNICLMDDSPTPLMRIFPLINLETRSTNFIKIRKVSRKLNDFEIGIKVVAKEKGIQDFLKKDCYEVKAFIIDEFEPEPMVLFSNFRTQYLSDFINKFDKYSSKSSKFNKLSISIPNMYIDVQDGDIFGYIFGTYEELVIILSKVNNVKKTFNFYTKRENFYYFAEQDRKYWTISNRAGLLYPRYSKTKITTLPLKRGVPTIYSKIIPLPNLEHGIHRDWKE